MEIRNEVGVGTVLEQASGRVRWIIEGPITKLALEARMKPVERRNAEEARLEEASHGEGLEERRRLEIGGRLHERGLAEGRRGGGGRRRRMAINNTTLSSIKASNERIKFGKERVSDVRLAHPSD